MPRCSKKINTNTTAANADIRAALLKIALASAKACRVDVAELLPVYGVSPIDRVSTAIFSADSMVSTVDAARILGVAPKTLENWRVIGKGPQFRRIGRRCLYRVEELHLFAEQNAFTSTSQYGEVQ